MSKNKISPKGSTWDELEQQLFTQEEIAESKIRVANINEAIGTKMKYKGYTGSVEWSKEDNLFFGQLLHIRSLISYEGKNAEELSNDFHEAVDSYLDFCEQLGIEPEQPVE